MSIICVDWETVHLHGGAWISHHRLRHRLFVERQCWDVPTYNGLEYDQFDTPAAKYLLWLDQQGIARGVTRLIPTTQPYMVKVLWPDLIDGDLPESPTIWEATRFGCDRDLNPVVRRRVVAEMICACQEFGIAHGLRSYLGVMPLGIFQRVIAAAGCPLEILGPVHKFSGHLIAAASIHISPEILANVRRKAGLNRSILEATIPLAA
jgi:N-acyl-L-homoserine lactone synthetase